MVDRVDRSGGLEEDPEVLRILRAAGDGQVYDNGSYREALYRLYDEIRSESAWELEQLIRDRGLQIKPPCCDSARRGLVEERRQYAAEFNRRSRRNSHEREIQAQLRRACECDALHGNEQSGKDLGCEIGYYSSTGGYSPDRCTHSPEPVQHTDVPNRLRIRGDSISLFRGVSVPWEELLQFVPPHRNAASD